MNNVELASVAILEAEQCLDSNNYQILIKQAKEAKEVGSERIVLDFQHTETISTFGMFALHTIISLFYNEPLPTLERWTESSLNIIKPTKVHALNKRLLFRNLKPHIAQALFSVGFYDYAEIFVSA